MTPGQLAMIQEMDGYMDAHISIYDTRTNGGMMVGCMDGLIDGQMDDK